jgi:hypothetical protein
MHHSITSSAMVSNVGGISSPMSFAVRLERDQPPCLLQQFGLGEGAIRVANAVGAVNVDVAQAYDGFRPGVLGPIKQLRRRRGLACSFGLFVGSVEPVEARLESLAG